VRSGVSLSARRNGGKENVKVRNNNAVVDTRRAGGSVWKCLEGCEESIGEISCPR
jgi:predicted metal-binding protein